MVGIDNIDITETSIIINIIDNINSTSRNNNSI